MHVEAEIKQAQERDIGEDEEEIHHVEIAAGHFPMPVVVFVSVEDALQLRVGNVPFDWLFFGFCDEGLAIYHTYCDYYYP